MKEWEYLEIIIWESDGKYKGTHEKKNLVKDLMDIRAEKWYLSSVKCANHFGKRGWELIKIELEDNRKWFFFKRKMKKK
tara:strand:- start:260 stop:496 length:237 start_codon:yes stop_codon:yes gene_type:complete